jgi:hypothetical protein
MGQGPARGCIKAVERHPRPIRRAYFVAKSSWCRMYRLLLLLLGGSVFSAPPVQFGRPRRPWAHPRGGVCILGPHRITRNEINAVTIIAVGNYAVADTNIDTDNIRLYEHLPVGWKRGPDLDAGSYCELRSHGVPVTVAYRLAWRVHWSIVADRYRGSGCVYPNVPL